MSNQHKRLILLRGLPGVGKTTLVEKEFPTNHHYEADHYFEIETKTGRRYEFDPAKLHQAHGWCQKAADQAMWEGHPLVVISNTFSRRWELAPYYGFAKQHGYEVLELTLGSGLTDEELAQRNVHGVPVSTIESMRKRWEY